MSVFTQAVPNWMERFGARRRPAAGSRLSATSSAGLGQLLVGAWRGLLSLQAARSSTRRLRLVEKISLGDKHFVALLEIDGVAFLASSGGSGALTLTAAGDLQRNREGRVSLQSLDDATPSWPMGDGDNGGQAVSGAAGAPPAFAAMTGAAAASAQLATSRPAARKKAAHGEKQVLKDAAPKRAKGTAQPANSKGATKLAQLIAVSAEPAAQKSKKSSRAHAIPKPGQAANIARVQTPKPASKGQAVANASNKPAKAARAVVAKKAPAAVGRRQSLQTTTQAFAHDRRERHAEANSTPSHTPDHIQNYAAEWTALSAPPLTAPVLPARAEESHQLSDQEQGITAANRFAALLELRMLASEVFAEIDSEKPAAPMQAEPLLNELPAPARGRRTASPISTGLHRLRRRLGGLACVGFLFLTAHGTLHAQTFEPARATTPMIAVAMPATTPMLSVATAAAGSLAFAQPATNGDIRISGLGGSSASWSIVVLLTILTLIPALLMCVTPFARMLIVFHFLRQALGLQTTPSNQTLIGLSLILTFFLMQPVGEVIYRDAIVPAQAGKLTPLDAVVRAGDPLKHFMARFVREKDAELFLEIAKEPRPRTVEDLSFRVMLPAYILSELKAGFQIGTVLFLPFLIVDMVVASITTSVGMMQLPPVVISTPLKLLLFLMVDGWHLLIGALMRSFN